MDVLTVSPKRAAQVLGIGRTKVYELIRDGQLHTVKLGNNRLIRVDSIRALVEAA